MKSRTEASHYDYGFRDYSPVAMRFTTVDPIRSGSNWYSYVGNDPVNYIDPLGLEAYDPFSTEMEAVEDFGITYNDDSIRDDNELGATVYQNSDGDYYYPTPNEGTPHGINMYTPPTSDTDTPEALVHTHGAESPKYDDENLSGTDKSTADAYGVDVYAVTPGGNIQKYDPSTGNTTNSSNPNIPSDPNSGADRQTNVDPNSGSNDPTVPLANQSLPPAPGGESSSNSCNY
ncbi:MAG: DUF4329 domain-containing protein [Spirochaetaceae bacterium]|nr:DUF4329 domain-containing protein [Spirochaetaceae bacterium]